LTGVPSAPVERKQLVRHAAPICISLIHVDRRDG
jgi:hypothetical protein